MDQPGDGRDCEIGFDEAAGAVTMRWLGYGSSAGFRRANEAILARLVARRVGRLIGEIEGLGRIPPEEEQWLALDWIPRAVQAGLERVALVTPAFALEHAPVLLVGERVAASLDLAYFDDPGAARTWVTDHAAQA